MTSLQVQSALGTAQPQQAAYPELDAWVSVEWAEFLRLAELPDYRDCKAYYHNGKMRIESMSTGSDHAKAHAILMALIAVFGIVKAIPLDPRDGCTYRHTPDDEFQPDASYYIGDKVGSVPNGTRLVELETYPKPDLVIEVSDTTLADDMGEKRLMYEELGVSEYWIWDVKNTQIIAFAITAKGASERITTSRVLPNLSLDLLTEALQRSQESDQSTAGAWYMQQLSA
ncbi:MAG: Uma2 family endonuclease [Cyanobacteria bacterium J06649_4]